MRLSNSPTLPGQSSVSSKEVADELVGSSLAFEVVTELNLVRGYKRLLSDLITNFAKYLVKAML